MPPEVLQTGRPGSILKAPLCLKIGAYVVYDNSYRKMFSDVKRAVYARHKKIDLQGKGGRKLHHLVSPMRLSRHSGENVHNRWTGGC